MSHFVNLYTLREISSHRLLHVTGNIHQTFYSECSNALCPGQTRGKYIEAILPNPKTEPILQYGLY